MVTEQLYSPLPGDSNVASVILNSEFLDVNGWHKRSVFGLGTTQIVSAKEDTTQFLKLLFFSISKTFFFSISKTFFSQFS